MTRIKRMVTILLLLFAGWTFRAASRESGKLVASAPAAERSAAESWERSARAQVYRFERRTRYPSIVQTRKGELLVLFTRQTEEQEQAGRGDLVLCRSTDGGKTWTDAETVYHGQTGEPRALGTMTRLRSGRTVAPFVEWQQGGEASLLGLLESQDDGKTWSVSRPRVNSPLVWLQPSGRVVEISDGSLVMAVHGAASAADLRATIHGCALLRSKDGGRRWEDFTWMANARQSVIGAAEWNLFSFEGASLQPLPDGRWLALVTARRLNKAGDGPTLVNEGPGSPEVLCRMWSRDQGRTWTRPDQLTPGAWAGMAVVGRHTLCANPFWNAWLSMALLTSEDGFETIRQELRLYNHEWLKGMSNASVEIPVPPTVPYIAPKWQYEHVGFPSVLPLGEDRAVVVFDRTQRGGGQIEGPEAQKIPIEKEQIEAVFYRKSPAAGKPAQARQNDPARPRGRWVLAERITVPITGVLAQAPNGNIVGPINGKLSLSSDGGRNWRGIPGATFPQVQALAGSFGILRNGRWLAAELIQNKPDVNGDEVKKGMLKGYPIFQSRGKFSDYSVRVHYSDDEGKTWQAGGPFKGPFKWAFPASSSFLEFADGTVAMTLYGVVTDEEMDSYSASNCIVRSHDGGKTWGDPSFVFRANPKGPGDFQPEPRFSELAIIKTQSGNLLAVSRCEYMIMGPKGWGGSTLARSSDGGRTWRRTNSELVTGGQLSGVALPHGGVAITYRSTSWEDNGLAISYDEGESFDHLIEGPYNTINAFVTGKDEFAVFTAVRKRCDPIGAIYRWVPDEAR